MKREDRIVCLSLLVPFALATAAIADEVTTGIPDPSIATSLPDGLRDPGGVRSDLAARGVTYGLNYIGEVLSNRSGGIERGTIYDGRLELYVDADLDKGMGIAGLAFHAHGYQLHGEGITATKVGNLNALSGIEALATTRLLEIWLEQKLFSDRLSIRAGQMAVDTEFILADSAGQFISASFGWPTITAPNLPNGGSAYPLAAPGVRVEFVASDALTVRAAVFNDDPAGPCDTDPQICNPHGLDFRMKDHPFVIAEGEYKYNRSAQSLGLPGTLKVGAWADFADFEDQRFDVSGVSLISPASTGEARPHDGNQGFYIIVDQQLYANADGSQSVSAFGRVMGAPSDRNVVDFYFDGGLTFVGLVPGRPADSFGVAAAYAHISDRASDLDHDAVSFGAARPIRNYEALIEINYIAEIVPGWTVQPDFQFVWNPGGNVADETGAVAVQDAAVIGVRTTLNY